MEPLLLPRNTRHVGRLPSSSADGQAAHFHRRRAAVNTNAEVSVTPAFAKNAAPMRMSLDKGGRE